MTDFPHATKHAMHIGFLAIEAKKLDRACVDWFCSSAAAGKTIDEAPDFVKCKAAAQLFEEAVLQAIRAEASQ